MEYFFIFDTKFNSLKLQLPKSNSKKYETSLKEILTKEKLSTHNVNKRFKQKYENDLKILGMKVENDLFIGCVVPKKSKDREVYTFIQNIQEFIILERKIKRNKKVSIFAEMQYDKFNKGGFKDNIQKAEESLNKVTNKAKQNLITAKEINDDIKVLDEEVQVVRDKASNMRSNATTLQREAYIYNKKVTILIYGSLGLLLVLTGLYITRILL